MQSDGCSELAGGLDRIHGDVLRVDGSLGRQRDGDLVGGDATEQLAGLGDLGGDFDDGTLDEFLGGNSQRSWTMRSPDPAESGSCERSRP